MAHRIRNSVIACAIVLATTALTAQLAPSLDDALRAIFEREEFEAQSSVPSRGWTADSATRRRAPGARDIVEYDTATGANGARRRIGAGAARREGAAVDRRIRVVRGQVEAADLHEHAQGLAAEHARRLLGARRSMQERPAP